LSYTSFSFAHVDSISRRDWSVSSTHPPGTGTVRERRAKDVPFADRRAAAERGSRRVRGQDDDRERERHLAERPVTPVERPITDEHPEGIGSVSLPCYSVNSRPNYFRAAHVAPAMSPEIEDETTVNESYSVTVPAAIRREAGVDAGDKLRWRVDDEGNISVELVKQRYGAFSQLDPVDIGEPTDAAEDHDLVPGDT
jgi:bifunctional DNA-binding transcriptional regulator/antitoxin component of YhaV-PrlF toxin-antitoxin module